MPAWCGCHRDRGLLPCPPHRPRRRARAPGRSSRREGGSTKQCCSAELLAQDAEGKHSGQISFVSCSVFASLSSTRMSLFQEQERAGLFQACFRDWTRPPDAVPTGAAADAAASCPSAEPVRQEEVGASASSIRNLFRCFLHCFHFLELFVT